MHSKDPETFDRTAMWQLYETLGQAEKGITWWIAEAEMQHANTAEEAIHRLAEKPQDAERSDVQNNDLLVQSQHKDTTRRSKKKMDKFTRDVWHPPFLQQTWAVTEVQSGCWSVQSSDGSLVDWSQWPGLGWLDPGNWCHSDLQRGFCQIYGPTHPRYGCQWGHHALCSSHSQTAWILMIKTTIWNKQEFSKSGNQHGGFRGKNTAMADTVYRLNQSYKPVTLPEIIYQWPPNLFSMPPIVPMHTSDTEERAQYCQLW